MKEAIKDLWYLTGIWMIMRLNRRGAAELLEKFGQALIENSKYK